MSKQTPLYGALLLSLIATPALAQALPRISSLYPPGARAGSTLDVAIRGGGLEGARAVLVDGPGLTAALNAVDVKIDPASQKVFAAKCGQCHELRGPATISRTADQWVATVDRMIREKNAPIEPAERAQIVGYVQAAARAAAGLTARVTIAPEALPGRREIRVVAANGTSTAFPFEVTAQPESLEAEPNNTPTKAPVVALPATVSGQLSQGDTDCFSFAAKQGERLVFNVSAYRLNPASQAFFFPVLYLYDATGKELARNNGYFSLDPLIDWTAPTDGAYSVMVRDMLYRGSPGSIYRLTMGALPYRTYLFPPGGRKGERTTVTLAGENMAPVSITVTLPADGPDGVRAIDTPLGPLPFAAGAYEEHTENPDETNAISLPASLNGRIDASGDGDRFTFSLEREAIGSYTFELFAERVSSPLVGRLTLRNARGQVIGTSASAPAARDPRLDVTLSQPGEYTLEVADAGGKSSPAHVYRVSAGPAVPDFALAVSPDNPNLGPGSSVYLSLRVLRRVGIPGNIEVLFPNLPAGVTAGPVTIRPDENQAFAILTAAPDAQPGAFSVAEVVARATVNDREITRRVAPFEIYRINNNAQTAYRSQMVVTVGPQSGWSVSLEPGEMSMSPDSGPVQVTVRLDRRGTQGDLPFAILGVPPGIQGPRALLFKRGTSEMTFTLTPTNTGVFAPRSGSSPPPMSHFVLAVVNGREGEGMMMASRPVVVRLE